MGDWRHTRSARLWLDEAVESDVDDLHAIHADPGTWRHLPAGRHTDREQSARMVAVGREDWARSGLGHWSVREAPEGPVVGRGGCVHRPGWPWWTLYYRLAPTVHGRGYGAELAAHAVRAAHDVDAARPVVAFLLEHNVGSRRTAASAGLREVWRGPDRDDPDAVRLVMLDRAPDDNLLERVQQEFGPR